MTTKHVSHLRVLLALIAMAIGTAISNDARAANTFRICVNLTPSYADVRTGQDYLVSSTEPARRHRARVLAYSNAYWIFDHYLDDNGCTPFLPIGAWGHEIWVTNRVKVAVDKDVLVYNNPTEQDVWHVEAINTPQNPNGDSTFTSTFVATLADHVSLVATRVSASSMVVPANAPYVEYRVYANMVGTEPGTSPPKPWMSKTLTDGSVVYIGTVLYNGQRTADARWRSVVGHEIGHQLGFRMWGYWFHNYNVNSTIALCNCTAVEDPEDRQHCLGSKEQSAAARSEGWAHSQATNFVNSATDAYAAFGYYKRQTVPTQVPPLNPPFTISARTPYNWLEQHCPDVVVGTQMDWLTFFNTLDNRAPDAFTIGNFWNVFQKELQRECTGPSCNPLTWLTLTSAAYAFFPLGSPKADNLAETGDEFGINH